MKQEMSAKDTVGWC